MMIHDIFTVKKKKQKTCLCTFSLIMAAVIQEPSVCGLGHQKKMSIFFFGKDHLPLWL